MALMPNMDSSIGERRDMPYTLTYIKQLLETDESEIIGLSDALRLSPQKEQSTGQIIYNYREVQMLRKALHMMKQGSSLKRIQTHFGIGSHQEDSSVAQSIVEDISAMNPIETKTTEQPAPAIASAELTPTIRTESTMATTIEPAATMRRPQPVAQRLTHDAQQLRSMGKENIAIVVESIANAREGMIKDMSRMLDDKLAGLDEVVVELIRCKSENDALKKKVETLSDEKESLEFELSRFHSTGFGFYRKN